MKKNEEIQIVVFELEGEEFGIDINRIKEIIRINEIINVPAAPEFIMGITNLRGSILPVVNTRVKLDLEDKEVNTQSRMLVIEKEDGIFGFVVDNVNEVIRINSNLIEETPGIVSSVDRSYIDGVLKLNDGERLVLLLNVEEVIKETSQTQIAKDLKEQNIQENKQSTKELIEEEQLVTFNLGKEEYGFDINKVREILRVREITPMPNAPFYVKGVETVRGALLPIIDLRKLFGENSLNDEIIKEIQRWSVLIQESLDDFSNNVKNKVDLLGRLENDDYFNWIESFATSDEETLNVLAKMKNNYKIVEINGQKLIDAGLNMSKEEKIKSFESDIEPNIKILYNMFDQLKNINYEKEQRILVVSINGIYVGITVDSVNEVKIVAKSIIEEIPEIISAGSKELKSAIKVDGGKKLIIVLDEEKLISETESKILSKMKTESTESDQAKKDLEEEQYVVFNIQDEEYGINIEKVNEINRIENVTKMPKTPEFIEGMTNLRGEIIPLISLRTKFSIDKIDHDNRTRIVIVEIDGKKIGMIVDTVKQIIKINKSDLEITPELMSSAAGKKFIDTIAKLDEGKRMIMTLDTDKMLAEDKKIIEQSVKKEELVLEQ